VFKDSTEVVLFLLMPQNPCEMGLNTAMHITKWA